jgi:drug/metabolite transporter (DMT)-like permease
VPVTAVVLVITSAFLHATWNLLAKNSRGGPIFFWQALVASVVVFLAPFLVMLNQNPIPVNGWVWIAATGLLHAAYFSTLSIAYVRADLSVAYPIARGLGPIIVLIVSISLLAESLTPLGIAGVFAVVIGIYTVTVPRMTLSAWRTPLTTLIRPEGRYATATGIFIAAYTLVDKQGVQLVHPLVYVYLMFVLSAVGVTILLLAHQRNWKATTELRTWRKATIVAVLWISAYSLVLFALRLAPAAYVAAARELSIVIGTGLGVFVLKEKGGPTRLIGATSIATGVALIAISSY